MKIAFFTNNYTPMVSGVARSVQHFRAGLEALGHEVLVVAPNYPGYKETDPHVVRYPSLDIAFKMKFPLAVPFSPKAFAKIEAFKPDIVHTQHPNVISQVALQYARKHHVPLVFTHHSMYEQYIHYIPIFPTFIKRWWVRSLYYGFANKCNLVICPTESVRQYVKPLIHVPTEVIPTGIDVGAYGRADGNPIRAKYLVPPYKHLLVVVSRVAPEKNLAMLLRVLKLLNHDDPNFARLLVVGDGPAMPLLKEEAQALGLGASVVFVGEQQQPQAWYRAADVFVYSSTSETQGLVIVEAIAAGRPVVAIQSPGVQDIITSGSDGILVSEEDTAFTAAVHSVLSNTALQTKLSINALRTAEKYSVEHTTQQLVNAYQQALMRF